MLISNVHKSIIVMSSIDTHFSKNIFEAVQKTRSTCFIKKKKSIIFTSGLQEGIHVNSKMALYSCKQICSPPHANGSKHSSPPGSNRREK